MLKFPAHMTSIWLSISPTLPSTLRPQTPCRRGSQCALDKNLPLLQGLAQIHCCHEAFSDFPSAPPQGKPLVSSLTSCSILAFALPKHWISFCLILGLFTNTYLTSSLRSLSISWAELMKEWCLFHLQPWCAASHRTAALEMFVE